MKSFLRVYLPALGIFLVLDFLWLGVIADGFYDRQIGFLMLPSPNWVAAALFYPLFVAGLTFFVILPAVKPDPEERSLSNTVFSGAFFGLVTYSAFDLTCLALFKDWPILVTIVDLIWGMILSTTVSSLTYMTILRLDKHNQ